MVGIPSASKMIFSSPKVIWILMNNMNQIQTIHMFWMTNQMSSMSLLLRRSGLILPNFLQHVLLYSHCQSTYLNFCYYRFNMTTSTKNKAIYLFLYYKTKHQRKSFPNSSFPKIIHMKYFKLCWFAKLYSREIFKTCVREIKSMRKFIDVRYDDLRSDPQKSLSLFFKVFFY